MSQKSCGNGNGTLKLKEFEKLPTAQQAAILHGLGVDVATWDAFVKTYESQQLEISEPHEPQLVKEDKVLKPAGMADSLISFSLLMLVVCVFFVCFECKTGKICI